MAAVAVSSASGLLALLDEDDESLKLYALQSLNKIVHEFWFQIASQQAIASVEAFYEDEDFSHRELAALVASKASPHTIGQFVLLVRTKLTALFVCYRCFITWENWIKL